MTLKDLQDAINNNEKEVATKLMKSADTLFTDYSKLISTLSFVKSKEMMAELLEYIPRSMIDFCSPGEISVLNIIIAYCIDLVKQLISKKHADINFLDGTGNTPLSLAVGTGKDVTFIEELIKLGADVNKRIRDELTPLHCAYQDKDVVALLIEHGADINAKDVHGRTILLSALQFKRKDEFILELINLGADIKIVDMDGNTVLHYVQSVNLINKFISMGIPINVKNNKGQTPLMTAVKFGEPEVVKILLQLGVDVDCFDLQLNSPFHFLKLKQENITRILELLIFCGCKVYTRNIDDETPLSHMLNRQLNRETIDPYKLIKYTLLANEFAALNTVDEVDLYLDDCNIQRYKEELSEMKLLNINYNNETYYSFCLEKAKFNKYFNETRCLYVHDEDEVKKLFPKLYAEIIMKMKTEKIRNDLLRFVDELIIQSKLYDEEADISPHSDGNNKITDTSFVDNSVNQAEENRADSSFSNPFQSNVVELNVDILYHVISYLNNIQIMNLYSATL